MWVVEKPVESFEGRSNNGTPGDNFFVVERGSRVQGSHSALDFPFLSRGIATWHELDTRAA